MNNIPFSLSIYDNAIWMRLIDVCERHKGIDITVYEMENMHSENGDIRIFAAGNTYVDTTSKYLEKDALKKVIHEPSIIVKSRGIIGFEYYDKPFTHKNEMWSYTTNDKRINLKFLYYYLSNNVSFFQQQAVIGKLPQISVKDTDEFSIPIIPLIYQNQIAECLYFIDKQIEQQRKELDALKQHKQALMQQLFPHIGNNKPHVRVVRSNQKWKILYTEEVFIRVTERNNGQSDNVLTVSAQFGLIKQQDFFDRTISNDIKDYYLIKKGDFTYNKSYSSQYPMGVIKPLKNYEDGVVSPLYICFRVKDGFVHDFFEHYFESGHFNYEIRKIAQEGARNHGLLNVSVKDFFTKTKLLVPSLVEEQETIAKTLSSINTIIEASEKKYELLKNHKRGLMQQLFPD